MKTEILRLDNVSLQMSGIMQLERFNLQIFSGEIMGLMALNAHGVSSLVSLLQSNTPVHFGRVYYCEQLVNSHIYSRTTPNEIVVIEQKSHLVNGLTVGDNVFVLSGVERRWLLHTQSFRGRLQELEQAVGVPASGGAEPLRTVHGGTAQGLGIRSEACPVVEYQSFSGGHGYRTAALCDPPFCISWDGLYLHLKQLRRTLRALRSHSGDV